jgi:hypothetical protein
VVTIDAANARTNTYGGLLTVLGSAVRGGSGTVVDTYGVAFGQNTEAGISGAAFGNGTYAGEFGVAFGYGSISGQAGFSAGGNATGGDNSFIFADYVGTNAFDRSAYTNEFAIRASGGTYFDTPELEATGTVRAESFAIGAGDPITEWPEGGSATNATLLTHGGTNVTEAALDTDDFGWDGTNITVLVEGGAYTNLFAGGGTTGSVTSAGGDAGKYLKADGTWDTPADTNTDTNWNHVATQAVNMAGFAITNTASITFTNNILFGSGALNGTNGIYFTDNGTNYWILKP